MQCTAASTGLSGLKRRLSAAAAPGSPARLAAPGSPARKVARVEDPVFPTIAVPIAMYTSYLVGKTILLAYAFGFTPVHDTDLVADVWSAIPFFKRLRGEGKEADKMHEGWSFKIKGKYCCMCLVPLPVPVPGTAACAWY